MTIQSTQKEGTYMRFPRLLLAMIAIGAMLLTVHGSDAAQRNGGSFHTLIDALNAADQSEVQSHLADNFTLTFTGGTTATGTDALQMMMLMDTPITIVSETPGGGQKGAAVLEFGGKGLYYTVDYTGARGGKFATWTISDPPSPSQ